MKKLNKFILALGSVASLASLPLIAANCGGTKEENKTPTEKDPGTGKKEDDKDGGKKDNESEVKDDKTKFTEASDKAIKTLKELAEKVNKYEYEKEKAKKVEGFGDLTDEQYKGVKKQITDRIDHLVKQIESWKTSGPKNIEEVNLAKGNHKTYDEAYDAMIKSQLDGAIKQLESISKDLTK
ncbi:variable surface lipoprotein [Metamycoplasma auris]|uniref:Lipoprotein n=1 Tax=Metamycoplasma auris TaxID=51363 RepID=A0A2W7I284_9BACT|nr:variable surface lipoprotein [Metamycoplasma auris]PZW01546.1 hypothetical protein BCF89_10166 [Metamycoplasma auris]